MSDALESISYESNMAAVPVIPLRNKKPISLGNRPTTSPYSNESVFPSVLFGVWLFSVEINYPRFFVGSDHYADILQVKQQLFLTR